VKNLRRTEGEPHEGTSDLTEYSPEYQDEYRRLWHEAAAERDRLAAKLEAAQAALSRVDGFLADPSGTPIDCINFARLEIRKALGRSHLGIQSELERLRLIEKAAERTVAYAEAHRTAAAYGATRPLADALAASAEDISSFSAETSNLGGRMQVSAEDLSPAETEGDE
jgi:hypothetical protein